MVYMEMIATFCHTKHADSSLPGCYAVYTGKLSATTLPWRRRHCEPSKIRNYLPVEAAPTQQNWICSSTAVRTEYIAHETNKYIVCAERRIV